MPAEEGEENENSKNILTFQDDGHQICREVCQLAEQTDENQQVCSAVSSQEPTASCKERETKEHEEREKQ